VSRLKTKAALLWNQPDAWDVREVELDPPKGGEVLVKVRATGLCRSDDHFGLKELSIPHTPFCGGHEGSGTVEEVGTGVRSLSVGDHVVTSFIPSCGRCSFCASGQQNLCDVGAQAFTGRQLDGTFRMHVDDQDVAQEACISTFAEWSVMPEASCIKVDSTIPFEVACLVGCGVPTGWGSAVYAAQLRPGAVAIVMGIGGIGINAVQGAHYVGASRVIAVDPVELKLDLALKLGATDAVHTIEEAADLARSLTNGQGADAAIVTVGVLTSDNVAEAFSAIRRGGTVVVTAVADEMTMGIPVNLVELAMYQKRIQGVLYGTASPNYEVPNLLHLYQRGDLHLDELITKRYRLEQINEAYDDLRAGVNVRGVITFDS
jgi:NDMA-dependent alcohol dehydrogenase